jgi:hypothetical protein
VGKENACRDRQASKEIGDRNDNKNMQVLREDLHSSGKCPALAGLLSGVQGEVSAGGDHHKQMPKMREDLHFPVKCTALAKILPGLSKKAQT